VMMSELDPVLSTTHARTHARARRRTHGRTPLIARLTDRQPR